MYIAHTPLNGLKCIFAGIRISRFDHATKKLKIAPQRHFFIGAHLGQVGIAMHA